MILKIQTMRILMLTTILFVVSFQGNAQKEKVQTMFVYNFTKYIKWPDNYIPENFVIGILGTSPISDDLTKMIDMKRTMQGKPITLRQFRSPEEIHDCHILIINDKFCERIEEIKRKIGVKPILVITEKDGMAQNGAVINFVEVGGKVRFELNTKNADEKGLKISGSLLNLAIIV